MLCLLMPLELLNTKKNGKFKYLSKQVDELTNEVRHDLHEICQVGCMILIYVKDSVCIVPAMKS
jgi:hypothetical protein